MNNLVTPKPWRDDDALAQPGQTLTVDELAYLEALANGNAPSAITRMHGTSRAQQQQLESALRAKLGAVSKAHLITRAFVLGVLMRRALVLALMLATLGGGQHQDAIAQRPARRPRTSVTAVRLVRANQSGGSRKHG